MTQEKPKQSGRFAPGSSGNRAGRPRGQTDIGRLRAAVAARAHEIVELLIQRALGGDLLACRLILDRALAPLKPVEAAVSIKLPGTGLANDGRAVLAAVAAGELSPAQGAALIGAVASLARVVELEEMAGIVAALEARIEEMEAR